MYKRFFRLINIVLLVSIFLLFGNALNTSNIKSVGLNNIAVNAKEVGKSHITHRDLNKKLNKDIYLTKHKKSDVHNLNLVKKFALSFSFSPSISISFGCVIILILGGFAIHSNNKRKHNIFNFIKCYLQRIHFFNKELHKSNSHINSYIILIQFLSYLNEWSKIYLNKHISHKLLFNNIGYEFNIISSSLNDLSNNILSSSRFKYIIKLNNLMNRNRKYNNNEFYYIKSPGFKKINDSLLYFIKNQKRYIKLLLKLKQHRNTSKKFINKIYINQSAGSRLAQVDLGANCCYVLPVIGINSIHYFDSIIDPGKSIMNFIAKLKNNLRQLICLIVIIFADYVSFYFPVLLLNHHYFNFNSMTKLVKLYGPHEEYSSTGLIAMLIILLVSTSITIIGLVYASIKNHNRKNKFITIFIDSFLEIISVFGILFTIISLMYSQKWSVITIEFVYRVLLYSSVASYGAIVLKAEYE